MGKKAQVTAFELDPAVVGDTDAHPFIFGGFPGRWQVGRPMLPDALGLTVSRMRELVKQFNLPLLEVRVDEADAFDTFEVPPGHIESGRSVDPVQDQPELIETDKGMIPGPIPSAKVPTVDEAAALDDQAEGEGAEKAAGAAEEPPVGLAADSAEVES